MSNPRSKWKTQLACAIISALAAHCTFAAVTVQSRSQRLSHTSDVKGKYKYEVSHNNLITDFKILSTRTFPFTNSKILGSVHSLFWKVSQATAKLAQFDMPDMNNYIGCYGNLPLIHKVHILSEMGENPSTDLVAFFETMKPMPQLPCLSFPE